MTHSTTPHTYRQYDKELEDIRTRVLAMGGLVERQIAEAVDALVSGDVEKAEAVISQDYRVNAMDVSIDEECTQILARRQPTAGDLRLVMAVIKTIADLERIGDGAERIGRTTVRLSEREKPANIFDSISSLSSHALGILRDSLDAFARMDAEAALAVAARDTQVDARYESILRQLITYMMEDPRNISWAVELIWVARALERIGDHACNICEYVIYLVKGKDVRHTSLEGMEQIVREK
ncbi:phosphate uptake regulator, PhoU [Nitrosococcus oceani ATCC 19707]|uniref:Phosphate-specific transport system accessory protein PhoU n=2 Tax=Nitrosococcus oceani TaxID=1229 RepID=Q3J8J3_NITOC|nr:phosphate signaling complex protein PhoU [Nitrosococcus oceani]ABA58853.1 phosphate uptake regulator, PhoU [Nitrosococcus oceani ATCC 19707]EDZ67805.1 phosphate transport system regulatory protein PhoU [Nitrosococcus oceani AFC27]KFI18654.1 transcriptional regulator PhoU [Nitrosococcus oceani C-27]GEM19056.1 phosphate transport system regulatory protein PhoU [Nitrosococcus oceani]